MASNFTWFNDALTNCQQVRSLVNTVQIWQWEFYMAEEEGPRMIPVVRWMDMDEEIFDRAKRVHNAVKQQPDVSPAEHAYDSDTNDLEAPPQKDSEATLIYEIDGGSQWGSNETRERTASHLDLDEEINLSAPVLADMLSDKASTPILSPKEKHAAPEYASSSDMGFLVKYGVFTIIH
ncbi:unnamed protein product [Somion occarium]|uniref:Uncharacterized protein n=1 Tax=Somion occarium TaxID=3059160 RepID=A0ABP1DVG4_9APHY